VESSIQNPVFKKYYLVYNIKKEEYGILKYNRAGTVIQPLPLYRNGDKDGQQL